MVNKKNRLQLAVLFALLGSAASALPASIPALALEFEVSASSLVGAVPVMFAGLFFSVGLAPLASAKFSDIALVRGFSLVLATGLFLLAVSPQASMFISAGFALGLGFGALEVLGTAASKRLSTDTASRLTRLNAIFAISAFLTPILFVVLSASLSPKLLFFLLFITALIFAVGYQSEYPATTQGRKLIRPNKTIAAFLLATSFYVGAETVIASWSAVLASELGGLDAQLAAIGGSSFWGLLALGRLTSVALTTKFLEPKFALALWLALAGISLMVAWVSWDVVSQAGILVAFGLAAIAAGPCYALIIGLALDSQTGAHAVALTSTLVLAGAAGGFALPGILQGFASIQSALVMAGAGFLAALIFTLLGTATSSSVPIKRRANERINS